MAMRSKEAEQFTKRKTFVQLLHGIEKSWELVNSMKIDLINGTDQTLVIPAKDSITLIVKQTTVKTMAKRRNIFTIVDNEEKVGNEGALK